LKIEGVILDLKPDVVIVFGDSKTTLAGALAAIKMQVSVCHVEAGLRSYDKSMPEEVNRILVDRCSQVLFAPTQSAVRNLKGEGMNMETVILSGDTMYDALLQHKDDIDDSKILKKMNLREETYLVFTAHRAENVDNPERLKKIITSLMRLENSKIVFPVHPRTGKRLEELNLKETLTKASNVILTDPLGYFDMLKLMKNSRVVLTDSGGMQKEAFLLHVPLYYA